jgi:hypothetical protein
MKDQERTIKTVVLERIEKSDDEWRAGNKMLTVSIDYKKDGWRPNPRGYYLSLHVNLHTDDHAVITAMSFGDEGDPYVYRFLQPAKMFSRKTLDSIVVMDSVLAYEIEQITATYQRRRATQLARRAKQRERMVQREEAQPATV